MFTKIEEEDVGNIWLDVTCHAAISALNVLRPIFENLIISLRADIILLLDYYFWSSIKDKCYADKPETFDALKDNIREAID